MSSVRKKDQTPHRFETCDKALKLYDHTTNLTANQKVFDRTYQSLIDRIDNEASMIYHLCRVANEELDARKNDEAKVRVELQQEALQHCLWLKTDIILAQRKFKFRAKKAIYWNGLVNDTMKLIKSWNDSEKKNLGCRL